MQLTSCAYNLGFHVKRAGMNVTTLNNVHLRLEGITPHGLSKVEVIRMSVRRNVDASSDSTRRLPTSIGKLRFVVAPSAPREYTLLSLLAALQ